jgi:hypothetical protein
MEPIMSQKCVGLLAPACQDIFLFERRILLKNLRLAIAWAEELQDGVHGDPLAPEGWLAIADRRVNRDASTVKLRLYR